MLILINTYMVCIWRNYSKAYIEHQDTNKREEVFNQYQGDMRYCSKQANEANQHTYQWGSFNHIFGKDE